MLTVYLMKKRTKGNVKYWDRRLLLAQKIKIESLKGDSSPPKKKEPETNTQTVTIVSKTPKNTDGSAATNGIKIETTTSLSNK